MSCGTCQSRRQYWLIWDSSHDKNVEKFVDIYSKPLCLWITSLVMQVFSGRVSRWPKADLTCTWIVLNTQYPTGTWFFIPVPPLVGKTWAFFEFRERCLNTQNNLLYRQVLGSVISSHIVLHLCNKNWKNLHYHVLSAYICVYLYTCRF